MGCSWQLTWYPWHLWTKSDIGHPWWLLICLPRQGWCFWQFCRRCLRILLLGFWQQSPYTPLGAGCWRYCWVLWWRHVLRKIKRRLWVCFIRFIAGDMWGWYWFPPYFLDFSESGIGRYWHAYGHWCPYVIPFCLPECLWLLWSKTGKRSWVWKSWPNRKFSG